MYDEDSITESSSKCDHCEMRWNCTMEKKSEKMCFEQRGLIDYECHNRLKSLDEIDE